MYNFKVGLVNEVKIIIGGVVVVVNDNVDGIGGSWSI